MNQPQTAGRKSVAEAQELFAKADLLALGQAADTACRSRHGNAVRTFAVDRNINFTNVCISCCTFCAFCRQNQSAEAYVINEATLFGKIDYALGQGATHILMQGGLHPGFGLDEAADLLTGIRRRYPSLHLHAFSPPEVVHFAHLSGQSFADVLRRLIDCGLGSLPGGGAEILADRPRQLTSPKKATADQWIEVMRTAHSLALRTTATMMYGHVESLAERLEHLDRLRRLQDETGGFTSFICWPFQAANTRLGADLASGRLRAEWAPDGRWHAASAEQYLRTLAVSRLFLDNFDHLQASWVTMGPKLGQVALAFGADDLGSTMIEENVVRAAGVHHRQTRDDLVRLIADAGFEPHQRDGTYRRVWPASQGAAPAAS